MFIYRFIKIWLAKHTTVRLISYRRFAHEYEYGYLEPAEVVYSVFKLNRTLLGVFPLPKLELFKERIPMGCFIAHCCTGSTGWEASHPQWIGRAITEEQWLPLYTFTNKYFLQSVTR